MVLDSMVFWSCTLWFTSPYTLWCTRPCTPLVFNVFGPFDGMPDGAARRSASIQIHHWKRRYKNAESHEH